MSELKVKTKDVIEALEKIKTNAGKIKEEGLRRRVIDAISGAIETEKKNEAKKDTRKTEFRRMLDFALKIEDPETKKRAVNFLNEQAETKEPIEAKNSIGKTERYKSIAKIRKEFEREFIQPKEASVLEQNAIQRMIKDALASIESESVKKTEKKDK